jgi:hypothetical protein
MNSTDQEKLIGTISALKAENAELRKQKDTAYAFRQRLAAILATGFPSVKFKTTDTDFGKWSTCLYIQLPTGQISFHYHDDDAEWLDGIATAEQNPWDGSSAETHLERLERLHDSQIVE